jgi:hypothetical protein
LLISRLLIAARDPCRAKAGAVRCREASSGTICVISDAMRWGEEILKEIDERSPMREAKD